METSSKSAPYVYKCIHKRTGKFYFGYRCANVKINRTSDVDFPINHTPWNAGLPTQDQVWFGKKHTEKSKQKMRKPKEKVTCPHCGMVGGISQMKRWHYNNCKSKAAI